MRLPEALVARVAGQVTVQATVTQVWPLVVALDDFPDVPVTVTENFHGPVQTGQRVLLAREGQRFVVVGNPAGVTQLREDTDQAQADAGEAKLEAGEAKLVAATATETSSEAIAEAYAAKTAAELAGDRVDVLEGTVIPGLDTRLDELDTDLAGVDDAVVDIRDNVLPPLSTGLQTALDTAAAALSDAERAYQVAIDAASGGPNLVANGGFELGDTGWTTNVNQQTAVVPDAHSGERVMVLDLAGGNRWPQSTPALSVEGERTYMVSVYVRAAQGSAQFHPYMRHRPAGGTWGATSGEQEAITGYQWRRVTAELTTPAGVDEVQFAPRGLQTAGAVLHVDDFAVHDITDAAEAIAIARNALQEARDAMDAANAAAIAAGEARSIALGADKRVQVGYGPPVAADGSGVPAGGLWWEYGGSPQTLRGMWVWTGSAWQKRDLDRTIIPLIDIGSGTFGDLDGVRLKAHTVATGALAVGGGDNLIADPGFTDPDLRNNQRTTTGTVWNTWSTDQPSAAAALRINTGQETANRNAWLSLGVADRAWAIPVTAGQEYVLRVWFRGDVGNIWRWTAATYTADGTRSYISISPWITNASATGWAEHVWTIPDGVVAVAPAAQAQPFPNNPGAVLQFEMPSFRHRIDGVTIKDGAVIGRHVGADEIVGRHVRMDEGFATKFRAALGEFDALFAGAIRAGMIDTQALDYKVAVGMHHRAAEFVGGEIISTAEPDNPDAANIQMRDARLSVNQPTIDGPQTTTSLGKTDEDDQLALYPLGSPDPGVLLSASGDGGVTGHFSVGQRLTVNGRNPLIELDQRGGRLLARARNTGPSGKAGATALGLVRMGIDMEPGRIYDATLSGVAYGPPSSQIVIELRQVSGGSAMWNSPVVARRYIPTGTGVAVPVDVTAPVSGSGTQSLLWTITGTAAGPAWMQGASVQPWEARIIDMGPDLNEGAVSWGGAGGTPFEPEPTPPPVPPRTHTKIYQATHVRSWRGSGTVTGELGHGYYGGFQRYSQIVFPAQVTTDLAGATNIRTELLLANTHTWASSGMTVRVLPSTDTGLRSSPLTTTGQALAWSRGAREYRPITGWAASHRSINLGGGAGTSTAAYGKFSANLADCLIKITYDK